MTTEPLFRREPETLDGYTPAFSEQETLLGYKHERVKIGGGLGDLDYDENNPKFVDRHTITVLGVTITGVKEFYHARGPEYYNGPMNSFETAAEIANEFLAKDENRVRHTEVFAFFQIHAKNLNNSKRYWQAWNHLQQIQKAREKVAALMAEIARAEIIASVNALSVKLQRSFSPQERATYLAEFNGGAFDEDTN